MKKTLFTVGFLAIFPFGAHAVDVPLQTCKQIRNQIKAVTGLAPTVNSELLLQLSMRQECQFSSAEVYRAAYGDKPLPKPEPHYRQEHDDSD